MSKKLTITKRQGRLLLMRLNQLKDLKMEQIITVQGFYLSVQVCIRDYDDAVNEAINDYPPTAIDMPDGQIGLRRNEGLQPALDELEDMSQEEAVCTVEDGHFKDVYKLWKEFNWDSNGEDNRVEIIAIDQAMKWAETPPVPSKVEDNGKETVEKEEKESVIA